MARKARKTKAAALLPALRVAPGAWPAVDVELWPVARLVPYARNARTHSDKQVREIAGLIARFGWTTAVLVDETGMLLAGHGRVMAAQLLKLEEVPVITARGWSEADKRAYVIADNKVAENAGWDKDLLAGELAALSVLPEFADLGSLGFSKAEVKRLLPEIDILGHTDEDSDTPPVPPPPLSRPGDIWLLGEHRLMCGDSTHVDHVAALIGGQRPNLMVTDPPYGVEYDPEWRNEAARTSAGMGNRALGAGAVGEVENDDRADWREAWALFPGDVAYVWHSALYSSVVCASLEACGFELRAQVIWDKTPLIIGRGDYHWQHEPCWYAVRKGGVSNWQGSRSQTTVWPIGHFKSESGHGTQKPIDCMKRPIANNSVRGDYVYEPFSGSGTTIIAGEMLARRVLAMEISPRYVDATVLRWEQFTKKTALLAAGELSFGAVAAQRAAERQAA